MTTATDLRRELFDLEKQYWEASKRGDSAELDRLTADKFTFVMGEGILSFRRPEFVEMMATEGIKITGYSLDEQTAHLHQITADVALLAYMSHIDYEEGGVQREGDSYTISLWVNRDGTWRCAAVTDTPISK